MKILKKLAALAWVWVVLAMVVACQEDPAPTPEPANPVITFNYDEVPVPKTGGHVAVEYTIENPVEGATLEIELGAEWMTNLDTTVEGIIQFDALPNDVVEERVSEITLTYSALEAPVTLAVRQEPADHPAFVYENIEVGINTFSLDVIPHDKETYYILFASNYSYLEDNGFVEDDDALFEDDMVYFAEMAEAYNMELSDLLKQIACKGDMLGYQVDGLGPNMDYAVYAYHLDVENQERLSDIYRIKVTTDRPEQVEVDFLFDFDIRGSIVDWTIDPNGYEGLYFWDAILLHDFYIEYGEDANVEEFPAQNWNNIIAIYTIMYGVTLEEIFADFCMQGVQTRTIESLLGETEYVFYAIAVDEVSGYAASEPTLEYIVTDAVSGSDMEIDINVVSVAERSATIVYTPTTDEPFAATYVEKEKWETYGSNDQERFEYLFKWYYFSDNRGVFTRQVEGLTPNTDYVAFAFGYMGGAATTRIFTQEFRTLEAEEGEVVMTTHWDAHYDIPACYELDPAAFSMYDDYEGYAFLPMTFEFTPETDEFYYAMYILLEGDEYSDAELVTDLIYSPQQDLKTIWVVPYNYTMLLAGFGVDESGNYGKLYREEILLTEDGVSDPQALVDLIHEWYPNAAPKAFRAAGKRCVKPEMTEAPVAPVRPTVTRSSMSVRNIKIEDLPKDVQNMLKR